MKKWRVRSHRNTSVPNDGQISLATPPPSAAIPSANKTKTPTDGTRFFEDLRTLVSPNTPGDAVTQNSRSQTAETRATSVTAPPETPRKNDRFGSPRSQTFCLSPHPEPSPSKKRKQTDLSDYEENAVDGSDSDPSSPLAVRRASNVISSKQSPAFKKSRVNKHTATKPITSKAKPPGKVGPTLQAKKKLSSTPSTPSRTRLRNPNPDTPKAPSKPTHHPLTLPSSPLALFSTIRSPTKRRTALIAEQRIQQLNAIDQAFQRSEARLAAQEREARGTRNGSPALPDRMRRMSLTPVPKGKDTHESNNNGGGGAPVETVASLAPPVQSGAGNRVHGYGHSQWTRDRAKGDRHLSRNMDAMLGTDGEGEGGRVSSALSAVWSLRLDGRANGCFSVI
jgi:hypothetical protein